MKNEARKGVKAQRKPRGQSGLRQASQKAKRRVSLVTGPGSGLGIAIIRRLLERGDEVRVIIREQPSASETWKRIPTGVIPYIADLRLKREDDRKALLDACRGVDDIYHLASFGRRMRASLDVFIDNNVIGTENLIKACMEANDPYKGVHMIFISTTQVYGMHRQGEVLTEESETRAKGPYAETKLMAEQVIKAFAEAHASFRYTIMRTGTLYGPRYEGAYYRLFKSIRDQKMKYIGNGESHLLLIHVNDVVKALLAAADSPQSMNKTYILTDGIAYTQRFLFKKAAAFLGVPPPKKTINPTFVKLVSSFSEINPEEYDFLSSDRVVSIAKIKRDLNFKPDASIDVEGKRMVDDFLARYRK